MGVFDLIYRPFIHVLLLALYLYKMGLIAYGVIYVLEMFDTHHPVIYRLHNMLFALYDPLLRYFPRHFPIQISIIILYLLTEFVTAVFVGIFRV